MSSETLEKEDKKRRLSEEEDERDDEDESDDDADDASHEENGVSARAKTIGPAEKVILDRPSSAKMVWTIAKREISSYFHSPITYTVISATLVVFGLWFFFYKGGFWQVDRATMSRMFDFVPAALCGVIGLFTMRSLSDEKRVGTIELLITMPVKDSEVILGKFIGSLAMVTTLLGLLVLYPLLMFTRAPFWHIGELDWYPYFVGMGGLFLMSCAAVAIGLMWSSFTESQILSYFATSLTLLVLYMIGSVTLVEYMSGRVGDALAFISLQSRFEPFARGIIDSRAIIYFLSLTALCLMIAFRSLESRKWS